MFGSITPMARNLLIVNIIAYVAINFLGVIPMEQLALYSHAPAFKPYQIFTHMFLHAGIFHLGFNMLGLYFLGTLLERVWGSNRFLIYYLICGLGAAGVHLLMTHLMGGYSQVVGASGAIYGLLMGIAMLFPNTEFMLLFIPVPIKAKYMAYGLGAISLVLAFGNFPGDRMAHFAHLGGMLVGFIMLKVWQAKKGKFY